MANIRDVAIKAGVSVATVSRVINEKGYVSEEAREKVLKAIDELEYQPSSVARVLAGKKMMTMALILPDISNPFFPELARAVEDVAQKNGFTVFLCNSYDEGQKEKSYIELLKRKYIDGIIFSSSTLSQEDINELVKNKIPIVVVDRAATIKGCSVISCRDYFGASLATEHLIKIGCEKIAHICGPQEYVTAKERLRGYEDTMKKNNLYNPTLVFPGDFSIDGGRQAIRTLLELHPEIDGVFAGNDLMAIGVMKELKSRGKNIPNDVAVCGFDGIQMASVVEPELTTVAQPIYELGALASQIIIDEVMDNCIKSDFYELGVKLIKRDSTKR